MIAVAKDGATTRDLGQSDADWAAALELLGRVAEALEREREELDDILSRLYTWAHDGGPPLPTRQARVADALLAKWEGNRAMNKTLFIRPVYAKRWTIVRGSTGEKHIGYALCRSADRSPLVDSDILDHFPVESTGREIKQAAVEFHGAADLDHVHWGKVLYA